ncbi:hypothetical protein D3C76_1827020 [compost metagenome]
MKYVEISQEEAIMASIRSKKLPILIFWDKTKEAYMLCCVRKAPKTSNDMVTSVANTKLPKPAAIITSRVR